MMLMIERLLGSVAVDVDANVDVDVDVNVDVEVDVDVDVDDDVDNRETAGKWEGAVNHCWWLWGKFTTPIIVIILSLQIMDYIVLTILRIDYIQSICVCYNTWEGADTCNYRMPAEYSFADLFVKRELPFCRFPHQKREMMFFPQNA